MLYKLLLRKISYLKFLLIEFIFLLLTLWEWNMFWRSYGIIQVYIMFWSKFYDLGLLIIYMTFGFTWPSSIAWFRLIGGYCEPSTGKYYDFPWKPEIVIFMEFLWKSWNCKHYCSSWNWDFDYHIFYYGWDPLYSFRDGTLKFFIFFGRHFHWTSSVLFYLFISC